MPNNGRAYKRPGNGLDARWASAGIFICRGEAAPLNSPAQGRNLEPRVSILGDGGFIPPRPIRESSSVHFNRTRRDLGLMPAAWGEIGRNFIRAGGTVLGHIPIRRVVLRLP
jgi:hypothetical protein